MIPTQITVEAIYEDGVLRPTRPLPLTSQQRVTLIVQLPGQRQWPENAAAIYQEIEVDDRNTAEKMMGTLAETWPRSQERP